MSLNFPNPSRSYDPGTGRVRFWGYDGALEVAFWVDVAALASLDTRVRALEDSILSAFDRHRERIEQVAERVYGATGARHLDRTDFRPA